MRAIQSGIRAVIVAVVLFLLTAALAVGVPLQEPGPVRAWRLPNGVQSLAFFPDGQTLLTGGGFFMGPGELTTLECRTGKQLAVDKSHELAIWGVAVSRDGKFVASAGGRAEVVLWDAVSRQALARFVGDAEYLYAVAFTPDGRLLAASGDKVVKVWDTKTRREVISLPGLKSNAICALTFSPDGKTLAVGDLQRVRLWDVDGFKERANFDTERSIQAISYSPDGKLLATGLSRISPAAGNPIEGWVAWWDAASGKEVGTSVKYANSILSIAFTADGRFLVSGNLSGILRGHEVQTNKEVFALSLDKTEFSVSSVAVSANGKLLATASGDDVVRLWNLADLLPLRPEK